MFLAAAVVWLATTRHSDERDLEPKLPTPTKRRADAQPSAPATSFDRPSKKVLIRTEARDDSDEVPYGQPRLTVAAGQRDGRWVTQGDILVDERALLAAGDDTTRIASLPEVRLWPDARVPYLVDDADEEKVRRAISQIETHTKVRFVPHEGEADYVVFRTAEGDTCESYLGVKGGEQEVLVAPSCVTGQVVHELLHALGLVHEHSREDRDDYVEIHWNRIDVAHKNQFQKLPAAISRPARVPFDYDSILLYPATAFSLTGAPTMTRRDGKPLVANRGTMSPLDAKRVDALYP